MRYVTSMHCLSLFRPAVGTCFVCVATPVASGPAVLFRTQRATALCADLVLSELSTLVLNEPKADVTRTASQTQDPRPPPPPLYQYPSWKHAKISSGTFKLCHLAQSVF